MTTPLDIIAAALHEQAGHDCSRLTACMHFSGGRPTPLADYVDRAKLTRTEREHGYVYDHRPVAVSKDWQGGDYEVTVTVVDRQEQAGVPGFIGASRNGFVKTWYPTAQIVR